MRGSAVFDGDTTQLISPRRHLLNEGHYSRFVQSTAQSLLTSPFLVDRDKSRYFFWIGVKQFEKMIIQKFKKGFGNPKRAVPAKQLKAFLFWRLNADDLLYELVRGIERPNSTENLSTAPAF